MPFVKKIDQWIRAYHTQDGVKYLVLGYGVVAFFLLVLTIWN